MNQYTSLSKFFHWLIALLIIVTLVVGFTLESFPPTIKPLGIMIHKSVGLTILVLMILRLIWILYAGRPDLHNLSLWEKILAHTVQKAFYVFIIAMVLVGWAMSTAGGRPPVYFGLFTIPLPGIPVDKALSEQLFGYHGDIAFILIGLIVLHVLGALKHHLIDKDNILRRMM